MNNIRKQALGIMARPAWPLCRLTILLFVTGGFSSLENVIDELPRPVDTGECVYPDPGTILAVHLEAIAGAVDHICNPSISDMAQVLDETGKPCDPLEAAVLVAQQEVISKELEEINSILCGPCDCTLCCTGPKADDRHDYFEIPLADKETDFFELKRIENDRTLFTTAQLAEKEWEFFRHAPALFHWSSGWSLVLPKNSSCPNLSPDGLCKIYSNRPTVCRKPQIFSYVIEKQGNQLIKREKLLAVTDCPYVNELKEEIAEYGRLCGLEVLFSRNKI